MLDLVILDAPKDLDITAIQRMVEALNAGKLDFLLDGTINLKLVDESAIRALNKEYSGQDKPTDVLSFSYIEDGQTPIDNELGDVAISLDAARKQAEQADITLGDELATLALHGILHIHGFDHADLDARKQMDQLQADILAAAKVTYRNFGWV